MRLLPFLVFSAFTPSALAADVPVTAGSHGCKVYGDADSGKTALWTGPCKDGFADGEGTLEWSLKGQPDLSYKGGMKNGRYDGVGYEMAADNSQYEGQYVAGEREGFGISLSNLGTQYDGHWKAGRREGQGKIVYALGGSYEGGWRGGKYHGKGTIVYAGGRRAEYEFVDGSWPDKITTPGEQPQFSVRRANASITSVRSDDIAATGLTIPAHLKYEQMSPEQRRILAAKYPLMDPADEPPYPAAGTRGLLQTLAKIRGMGTGSMKVLVTVGPDGTAQSLVSAGSPNPNTTKIVQYAFMLEKYKPGKCAGTPCTMMFPMYLNFKGNGD